MAKRDIVVRIELDPENQAQLQELFNVHLLEVLNRAVAEDHEAVEALLLHRVKCNRALTEDLTIQVGLIDVESEEFDVGLMGILSGLAGTREDGYSRIASVWDIYCSVCDQVILNINTIEFPCNVCGGELIRRLRGFERTRECPENGPRMV
jgi:predicted RNA-binding Zn-ribbon protein involved in translation (DUF1610 family)